MKLGKFNQGEVIKRTDFGVYLDIDDEEVLLPLKYVPTGTEIGDELEVFIYKDSQERNIATTLTPEAKVGEFAYLKVKEVNRVGAFLDWGLEKDLFVPFAEQEGKMKEGKSYVVRVFVDQKTDRITASQLLDKFIEREQIAFSEGDKVDLLIYKFTDLGVKVIINNKHYGLIYNNDLYRELEVGQETTGYIKKIREDKKIDVSLRKIGYGRIEDAKEKILKQLVAEDGFLPLHDKSSPQAIKDKLQMSKGSFKKAIGGLYKEKIIDITKEGIKLKK
ncbi:S1-like domain-containing RNA-binding protein [Natroniella sulfidigena]|uniref:CvfB family protein n=1 Tax=Natroniella sulfidigena TaxID=723921 RepID=UPI00200A922C|nr:S1-like domain-containing RNA-binding protein [Natroniella sulfidigena]